MAVDIWSVANAGRPYVCFAYDQRNPDRCNQDVNTYGGCCWRDCVIHDDYNKVRGGPPFFPLGTRNSRAHPAPTDVLPDQLSGNWGMSHLEPHPKPHRSQYTKASPGTFFWCNSTLSNCMNSSDPGPCFVVTVVPQLTLYGESELTWLLPPSHPLDPPGRLPPCPVRGEYCCLGRPHRGALRNSLVSAQDFNDKLQLALESTTVSFSLPTAASDINSQVSPTEPARLRPSDAERGGTCIFLQEECCYYINESRVVEQNVQTLTKLSEELHTRHSRNSSLFGWLQSPLATWVLPMIGPLILICVFSPSPLPPQVHPLPDCGDVMGDCESAPAPSLHSAALRPASA
ncbi:endogenous retrovirus group FC1 Env polyprotein-like [Myotis yumanensis]|uniref:endogenous retrovirus group FC1 Env polyprotein-like n=1 Tax=Myotis yumanensis TaxID=159337 RepID=UPI0038D0EB2B